jgi:hypothetical protein
MFLKANMVVTEPIKTTKKSFVLAFLLKKLLDRYLQKEPINIYIIFFLVLYVHGFRTCTRCTADER